MENTLTVRSQTLVQPSKARRIFTKFLWVCVGFLIITALISFFATGFHVSTLLSCSVAAMILSRFTAMPENAPHYESDLAHISFEQDALKICYQSSNRTSISILYSDITTVEHSDQLHCFRLAFTGNVEGTTNGIYHLLYMEDERAPVFVKMLAEHTEVPVQFLN